MEREVWSYVGAWDGPRLIKMPRRITRHAEEAEGPISDLGFIAK